MKVPNSAAVLGCAALIAGLVAAAAAIAQQRQEGGAALDANPQVYLRAQDGAYLDANLKVGSGGYNYRSGRARTSDGDIWSRRYYNVTRTGKNRYNVPTTHTQRQRYRATRPYTNHNYHRTSYGRSTRQSSRMR